MKLDRPAASWIEKPATSVSAIAMAMVKKKRSSLRAVCGADSAIVAIDRPPRKPEEDHTAGATTAQSLA